jgi:hypothetical protein
LAPATDPPISILAFQFAWSPEEVQKLVGRPDSTVASYLRLSLWLDFGLIAGYALFLTCSCWAIGDYWRERSPAVACVAGWLAGFVIAAAVADVLENGFLFLVLADVNHYYWPKAAAILAGFKFVWLAGGFLFVLVGGAASLAMWVFQKGA